MVSILKIRNLVKEIMKSQGFEIENRPMPRIVYGNKNCYQPFYNKIIIIEDYAIIHEIVHSLQPSKLFEKKYIHYRDNSKEYMNQACERQAYAIENFLNINGKELHSTWNFLPKRPGRSTRLKINGMIRGIK